MLIGIPVFSMTAAALILETVAPTAEERATGLMGRADLLVYPISSADAADLAAVLPAGATVEAVGRASEEALVPGTRVSTEVAFMDLDGLAAGKLVVTVGRAPSAPDEVAVSADLAREAGAGVGGELTLQALGSLRIVGIVEAPQRIHWLVALADPSRTPSDSAGLAWLVGLPAGVSEEDVASVVLDARKPGAEPDQAQQLFNVTTRDQGGEASETLVTLVFVLGALALIEAALVASAAFAVGIRRRQRELGLLGAVGGTPRQMAVSVLVEGAICGGIAAVLGVVLGMAAAFVARPFLDELTGRRVGPLEIDALAIAVAVLIGMGAALIAASVPAWGAARLPTLVALSGRRPPTAPARRLLSLGLALVAIALGCTIVTPVVARLSAMPILVLLVGAVTGVLGFGACSPWLLERLEGPARRLPLAARIAVRDTSRARTRNGPIVTAVLASVAGMIALSAMLASQAAMTADRWIAPVPPDVLIVGGSEAITMGPQVADALGAIGSGPMAEIVSPGAPHHAQMTLPLASPNTRDAIYDTSVDWFVVGDEDLLRGLGGASATETFRTGAIVVFPWQDVRPLTRATIRFMDESYQSEVASFELPITVLMTRVPVAAGGFRPEAGGLPDGIIPTRTAQSLGLVADPAPSQYLVRLAETVTQQDVDLASGLAAAGSSAGSSTYVTAALRPADPIAGFRLALLATSLVVALSVTGVAVALGETEARADQRTLLALGADRRLRRRVTAARGAVLAGLAGLLAVPAGLLPVWGVLFSRGWPIVVPLPEVIGAIVILPLMAVAGGLVLGRPIGEWATRRDDRG